MTAIRITRFAHTPMGTFGSFWVLGKQLYTCERPWLDNAPFVSCIPEGEYAIKPQIFHRGNGGLGYPAERTSCFTRATRCCIRRDASCPA